LPLVVAALWYASEIAQCDDFAFLGKRSPVVSGADRAMAHLVGPAYYRYRVYSWKTDYRDVIREADQELSRKGYRKTQEDGLVRWETSDFRWVEVAPGESRNREEAVRGRRGTNPAWVTVTVTRFEDESLAVLLRTQFEPYD
jgi:hypothetical protein